MKKQEAKGTKPLKAQRSVHSPYWNCALIILIILLSAVIRFRYLDSPLERDEGEYAYAGQLILQGIPPYQLAYNMKLPGTYAACALILALFGQTPSGIHAGLLIINACTSVLVYFLTRRLFGSCAGVVACATYAFLSLGQPVFGMACHATHFVLLPAIGGFLLLLEATREQRSWMLFFSGSLVGMSFVMKQPGVFFIFFAIFYFCWTEFRARPIDWKRSASRGSLLVLGVSVPFALTCLILWWTGVFGRFWFWTFTYARQYAMQLPLSVGIDNLSRMTARIVGSSVLIWVMAVVGLVALMWKRNPGPRKAFVLGLLVSSFAAICPGLYFREHYFILMLPVGAVLVGFVISFAEQHAFRTRRLPSAAIALFLVALGVSIFQQRSYLFDMDPITACRVSYGANPFPESREIAKYVRDHTSRTDCIGVIGSEPEIYFYSDRHSATGYIYTYGLMEDQPYAHRMQEEMIAEVKGKSPAYLIVVNTNASWLVRPGSDKSIFSWVNDYIAKQYTLDGIVDVLSKDQTVYLWGSETRNYQPRSSTNLLVFKRGIP